MSGSLTDPCIRLCLTGLSPACVYGCVCGRESLLALCCVFVWVGGTGRTGKREGGPESHERERTDSPAETSATHTHTYTHTHTTHNTQHTTHNTQHTTHNTQHTTHTHNTHTHTHLGSNPGLSLFPMNLFVFSSIDSPLV